MTCECPNISFSLNFVKRTQFLGRRDVLIPLPGKGLQTITMLHRPEKRTQFVPGKVRPKL
jgi:hypothetical protein